LGARINLSVLPSWVEGVIGAASYLNPVAGIKSKMSLLVMNVLSASKIATTCVPVIVAAKAATVTAVTATN
jgi:hypothetical protein